MQLITYAGHPRPRQPRLSAEVGGNRTLCLSSRRKPLSSAGATGRFATPCHWTVQTRYWRRQSFQHLDRLSEARRFRRGPCHLHQPPRVPLPCVLLLPSLMSTPCFESSRRYWSLPCVSQALQCTAPRETPSECRSMNDVTRVSNCRLLVRARTCVRDGKLVEVSRTVTQSDSNLCWQRLSLRREVCLLC